MDTTRLIESAKAAHREACSARDLAFAELEKIEDTASDVEARGSIAAFDEAQAAVEQTKQQLDRLTAIAEARANTPPAVLPGDGAAGWAVARGSLRTEHTYRPDTDASFFRDLVLGQRDPEAQERLLTHSREMREHYREHRDVTSSGGGAGVIPPVYLGEMYAELPRESRPFADIVPKRQLPDVGTSISIPQVGTGTSVAVQAAEADALSETNVDVNTIDTPVNTIAGIQDLSLQALERSEPGLDLIVFEDLRAAYDGYLDTQLLSGSGASGQHLGIRAVSSINTVTYTDASPTAAEALPKIYDGIQKIGSNRYRNATHIVMHPRRAAWFGSQMSSTFPLFQQGALVQASGTQNGGFLQSFAGLQVVIDANVGSTYGAGTNEDEIYLLHAPDLILMEGVLRMEVFRDVLSGTGQVRLRAYSYSAFVSERQPKALCAVSGTGLATPTW